MPLTSKKPLNLHIDTSFEGHGELGQFTFPERQSAGVVNAQRRRGRGTAQNNDALENTRDLAALQTSGTPVTSSSRSPMEKNDSTASIVLIQTHQNIAHQRVIRRLSEHSTEIIRSGSLEKIPLKRRSSVSVEQSGQVQNRSSVSPNAPGSSSPRSSTTARRASVLAALMPHNVGATEKLSPPQPTRTTSPRFAVPQLHPSQQTPSPQPPASTDKPTISPTPHSIDDLVPLNGKSDGHPEVMSSATSFIHFGDMDYSMGRQQVDEDLEFSLTYTPRLSLRTLVLLFSLLFLIVILLFLGWNVFFVTFICVAHVSQAFSRVMDTFALQAVHVVITTGMTLFLMAFITVQLSIILRMRNLLHVLGKNMLHLLDIRFESIKRKSRTSWISEVAAVEHAFFQLVQLIADWKGLLPQHFFLDVASERNGGDNIVHKMLDFDNFVKYLPAEEAPGDFSDASSTMSHVHHTADNLSRTSTIGHLVKQPSQTSSINSATSTMSRKNKIHPLFNERGQLEQSFSAKLSRLPFEQKIVTFMHIRIDGSPEQRFLFFQTQFDTIIQIVQAAKATLISFDESSIDIVWNAFVKTNVHARLACSTADALISLVSGSSEHLNASTASADDKLNESLDKDPASPLTVEIGICTGLANCGVLHRKYCVYGLAKDVAQLLSRLCQYWKTQILINEGMTNFAHDFVMRPLDLVRSTLFASAEQTLKVYQLGPRRSSSKRFKNWMTEMNFSQTEKRFKKFSQIFDDALIKGDVEMSYDRLINSADVFREDPQAQIFLQILERLRVSEKGTYCRMHDDSLTEKIQ